MRVQITLHLLHSPPQTCALNFLLQLENHLFADELSCPETAYRIHLLHKKVKSLTGMSIANYINHIGIEKAKDLLKSTQLSISEIAYDVGFTSSNYFARSFKK